MTQAEVAYKTSAEEVEDRNDLVMQELSQVYYIASRIRERLPQHVELEDLVNAGVIGLLEASRTFDSSKNAQFKTFAKFRIRGAILDSLRDADWGSRYLRKTRDARLRRRPRSSKAGWDGILSIPRSRRRCRSRSTVCARSSSSSMGFIWRASRWRFPTTARNRWM